MRFVFVGILISFALIAQAQNNFKAIIKDSTTKENLIGVTAQLKGTSIGVVSDVNGTLSLSKIPNGKQTLLFSFVGYHSKQLALVFPLANSDETITVLLESETENLEEVTVSATRTNSRIEDLPMKVEVLGIDDMEEENSIKPASIASILGDLSVIHIQQTSAVNGSSVVRMQGLDGKYTQMLRDGLPLYEGFSGSFGILQIPPLDLKQVEIIKGSTSTLYGGGAIAGMINLVSKAPTTTRDFSITLNSSTLKESNINIYFSQQFGKFGMTFFGGTTTQKAIDVNGDGFSDVPEVNHLTLHPKFFYNFSDKTKLNIGLSYLIENRTGGDMLAIGSSAVNSQHPYFQKNVNQRVTTDFTFSHNFNSNHKLTAKGTVSNFDRKLTQANFGFGGRQASDYIELSDYIKTKSTELVFGANITSEKFAKNLPDSTQINDFWYHTLGYFGQLGWHVTDKWLIETGLRTDFHNVYGTFVLPRIAFLYKANKDFSVRLSSGAGYKTPNVFTASTTAGSLKNLLPIDISVKPERSIGVNMDINYNFNIGEHITATLNQAFYYSNIQNPIIASQNTLGFVALNNAKANVNSLGTDTYIRFVVDHVELYLGYNHTISKRLGDGADVFLAFGPQGKFSSTLTYEIEGKWRFGIENSWIGNQYATLDSYDLTKLRKVPNYWFWAGMIERKFGTKISFVLNGENWFDYRQSNTEQLFTGTIQNPNFVNLWAPIDGRVVNLALRVKI
jgi:outer membrane receptor for ferrienterochelin and colicins